MRHPAANAAAAVLVFGSRAHAAPYTQPAPPMQTYIDALGFLPPTDPAANLDARSPQHPTQFEAYLLEGAEAGSMTGDPVLLAWFAGSDASRIAHARGSAASPPGMTSSPTAEPNGCSGARPQARSSWLTQPQCARILCE